MPNPLNPLDSVATIADSVATGLDELFTSDEEREQAKYLMMKELNQPHIMQAMITMQEAKHPSMFVSGWRPALGWLSVFLLAYAWVFRDFLVITLKTFQPEFDLNQLPQVEAGEMMTLVLALLGLGATRTYEKLKGVSRDNMAQSAKPPAPAKAATPASSEAASAPASKPKKQQAKDFSREELTKAFERDPADPFGNYDA